MQSLAESLNVVTGRVRGTESYQVRLWVEDSELAASCTCPWAAEGNFCKHCVAVGLAWLERSPKAGKATTAPVITPDDVRALLRAEDKERLVEIIMHTAATDNALAKRLVMQAARSRQGGPDMVALSTVLSNAFRTSGFVSWKQASGYARRIHEVIDGIEELLREGYAAQVIELVELGLRQCERAFGKVDDSDGEIGGIRGRLEEMHLLACREAKPEPEALARKLFAWEMKSEWDVFREAARTYAQVLGPEGLAMYRKLAAQAWAKVPTLEPGDKRDSFAHGRFAVTSIMEVLAELSGDIEEQVAVKSRDLTCAYHFLEIAEMYRQAGQNDKALEWAEKGVKAFPDKTDSRLREFLAEEYHRRNRHDEAMALVWNEFADDPSLESYQLLKRHADRVQQWPSWREDALTAFQVRIRAANRGRRRLERAAWDMIDHSDLVCIFLWEKNVEEAWQEAQAGGCSAELWMELAAKREKEHPADAVTVYQRQVGYFIDNKGNDSYEAAVRLLHKLHRLMAPLGRTAEFNSFVTDLRARHKPKRNFTKLLDRANWT